MLLDLLKTRTSIRGFAEKEVPEDVLLYILEAGRLAPSGGNEQPWKFGVITDRGLISEISTMAYNQKWIETAGFLIVLCTTIVGAELGGRNVQMARFPKLAKVIEEMDNGIYSSLHMEEHQTKIPGTHMVCAGLEHGVASTWVSYYDVNKVTNLLHLPKGCMASEILAFGYPAQPKAPNKKKSLDEVVFYNQFS